MSNQVANFSMYTKAGDAMVAKVVERAKRNFWTWPMTYAALEQLARNHPEVAGEATDTAVRESVYYTLQYKENFYC